MFSRLTYLLLTLSQAINYEEKKILAQVTIRKKHRMFGRRRRKKTPKKGEKKRFNNNLEHSVTSLLDHRQFHGHTTTASFWRSGN